MFGEKKGFGLLFFFGDTNSLRPICTRSAAFPPQSLSLLNRRSGRPFHSLLGPLLRVLSGPLPSGRLGVSPGTCRSPDTPSPAPAEANSRISSRAHVVTQAA